MEAKLRAIAQLVCRGEATVEHERFIVASYAKVFRKPFARCKCQLCDAIFQIIKKLKQMEECKFKLKKGIVLVDFGSPIRITHQNLTNENAITHLKRRPQDAKFFDYIPADVMKAIKGEKPIEREKEITIEPEIVRVELEQFEEPVQVKPPVRRRTRKKK